MIVIERVAVTNERPVSRSRDPSRPMRISSNLVSNHVIMYYDSIMIVEL